MIYDVAVIGSGFSAISLVTSLLERLPSEASIAVIGDDAAFGRGTAYRTELHLHRLNVPAARMSAFADKPDDFLEWLRKQGRATDGTSFASRNDYGLYLRDTLASVLRKRDQRTRVDFIKSKAVKCLSCAESGATFQLNDGRELRAANVALCLGVGTASLPRLTSDSDIGLLRRVVRNPWRLGWLSRVGPDDTVAILGSGLTMIDQVLSLRNRGHRGKIHVLSRRGLAPHAHTTIPVAPVAPNLTSGRNEISQILHDLRRQVRGGEEWRSVMDGLRPQTQTLWQKLTQEQRSRFLRHALAWWNIHRHRVAPQVHDVFDALLRDGAVTLHAGFISKITRQDKECRLIFRKGGSSEEASISFDWLVNCTGMERAGIGHSPLLGQMKDEGVIDVDPLGLGICVNEASRILSPGGVPQSGLYAVGALTAGQFWEITAVPDIRNQNRQVADEIVKSVTRKQQSQPDQ